MISLTVEREEFAARRRKVQDELVVRLQGVIGATFGDGDIENLDKAIETMFREVYESETDQPMRRQPLNSLRSTIRRTLGRATDESNVHVTALMVANAIINAATAAAADADPEGLVLEWTTMHDPSGKPDKDVRATHAETDGQQRAPGVPFDVAGHEMRYPGDPTAPVELWINCRCVLQPAKQSLSAAVAYAESEQTQGVTMTVTEAEKDVKDEEIPEIPAEAPANDVTGVPWHGVLAPEGVMSGDKRMFAKGSLRHRDLPLALTWQKSSAEGHDNSVVVAMIEKMERIDDEYHGSGHMLTSQAEADELVGLIGEFGRFGVSVDADDAEMEYDEENDERVWTDARVCSASVLPIPAFAEAYVALGPHPILDADPEEEQVPPDPDAPLNPENPAEDEEDLAAALELYVAAGVEMRDVPKEERDKRADDGTAMPDGSYPIANCSDLSNAIQAIGRAKDPEATKKHIKKRHSALNCPDVELPEGWAVTAEELAEFWADVTEFKDLAPGRTEDGPGWLTHPVDTDRLRDYWVRGPGAAEVGWGTPGDFNRCRIAVAQYVKPQYINGYCANRHYDALGIWPGEHLSAKDTLELSETEMEPGPELTLVASARPTAPAEWFKDPKFTKPSGQTITDEGEVYGHLAEWGVCHIGIDGVCAEAPPSASDYAFFAEGTIDTTEGPVRVGQLTVDIPHAGKKLGLHPAQAHYDDTTAVWADVAVGEDEYGIWYHGMVRPGTPEEKLHAAKASGKVSGDWRWSDHTQGLELVAALTVNTRGFQIKPQIAMVAGAQVSLIAAGMVSEPEPEDDTIGKIATALADELEARESRKKQMAELREQYAEPVEV